MLTNLTFDKISNIASDKKVLTAGEKYFKDKKITNLNVQYNESTGYCVISSDVYGESDRNTSRVNVFLDNYKDVYSYRCNCTASSIWKEVCGHIVGVLITLLYNDDLRLLTIKNEYSAKKLLKVFEHSSMKSYDIVQNTDIYTNGNIIIEPTLNITFEQMSLSFKVGNTRLYQIKHIEEFAANIKNSDDFRYGKNLEFNHNINSFNEDSQKIARFITKQCEIFVNTQEQMYMYASRYNRHHLKKLDLSVYNIDEFYNLFVGKYLNLSTNDKSFGSIFISETSPQMKFSISFSEDMISLTSPNYLYYAFEGSDNYYILIEDDESHFYKVSYNYYHVFHNVMNFYSEQHVSTITFENEELVSFKNVILPKLLRLGLIDNNSFDNNEVPIMTSKIYLDFENKNASLRLLFCYNDVEFNPLKNTENLLKDVEFEQNLMHFIKLLGFIEHKDYYLLEDPDKIYELFVTGISTLNQHSEVYLSENFKLKSARQAIGTKIGVRIKENLLELSVDTGNYSVSELMEIASNYKIKKKYYRLKNGKFVTLDSDLSSVVDIFSDMGLSKKDVKGDLIKVPKYKALYLDNSIETNDKEYFSLHDAGYLKLIDDFKNYETVEFNIPNSLKDTLRPYQITGFKWLKTLANYGFGGILADDMGLGKTLQVIALLESELDTFTLPSLVVAPTSLIYNWEQEILKFSGKLKTVVISGNIQKRTESLKDNGHVYITTYDMLKRDIDSYLPMKFKYVIADEAQYIKNHRTQNAKSLKLLNSEVRFALTGTPIENSLTEIWSIFDFIMPNYLGNVDKFIKDYETPIIKNKDMNKAKKLQKQIRSFLLRRLKKDVLKDLPAKIETTLYANMNDEQANVYMAYLHEARGVFQKVSEGNQLNQNKLKILALLTRLRQICCHPSLFIEDYKGESSKLTLAIDTINSSIESGHRVLLFSQFTSMLEIIKKEFAKEKIKYFYLDGATNAKKRIEMVDKFNSGENDIFLISLKAGGTGLNLMGADVVIHYDPWWNPAVMNQASDRTHRYGQKKVVQVINLVVKDSIEEKIMELQNKKKDLVDAVITEGTSFITKMTEEELKDLFL
jgi:SNF2 family DNA or RNA helicase